MASHSKTAPIGIDTVPASDIAERRLIDFCELYISHYGAGDTHTARAKKLDIGKFIDFLQKYRRTTSPDVLLVKDWDTSATQHFVDDCLRRGEAPTTTARRLATLKHLGRTFAEKVPGFINPARDVRPPRIQPLKPKSLDRTEVLEVLHHGTSRINQKDSFSRRRNDVLIRFLLDTGLRADEVRTMRRGQLDEKCEWIDKVRTKGRRFRTVYVTTEMRPLLREYLLDRSRELSKIFPSLSTSLDAKLPLFVSLHGATREDPESLFMSPKSVWRAVRESSVATKLHPHLLRHTYAIDLLEESRDIRLVAQALGHSDVRVTMRYTERTNEEIASTLEKVRRRKDK